MAASTLGIMPTMVWYSSYHLRFSIRENSVSMMTLLTKNVPKEKNTVTNSTMGMDRSPGCQGSSSQSRPGTRMAMTMLALLNSVFTMSVLYMQAT